MWTPKSSHIPVTLCDEEWLLGGAALRELLVSRSDAIQQIRELTLLVGAEHGDRGRRLTQQVKHAGRDPQPGISEDDRANPTIRGVRLPPGQPALLECIDHGRDVGRVAGERGSQLTHRSGPGAGQPQQRLDAGRGEIMLLADPGQPILALAMQLDLLHGTPRTPGIDPELLAERAAGRGDGHTPMLTR